MRRPILLATPLLLLAACGGGNADRNAAAPGQPGAQAAPPASGQPPAQFSVATPDGRAEVRTGAAAGAWPDGLPPYPGATTAQNVAVTGATPERSGHILGFRTADAPAQVITFYADAGARAGYRVVSRAEAGPTASLVLQRGAGGNLAITATRTGDFTMGQIISAGAGQ